MTFQKTAKQIQACKLMAVNSITRILLYGGSRSGKSFVIVRALFVRALRADNSRHVIFRFRFNHAKVSLWEDTIPQVAKLCFSDIPIHYNKTDYFIEFPNGSQIWIAGLDDKERTEKILGTEYASMYFNEISQIAYKTILMALTRLSQKTILVNKAYFDCNPPSKRHWSYTLFFKKNDPIENTILRNPDNYDKLQMNPHDNAINIDSDYIGGILEQMPLRQKIRFLKGEYSDDIEGTLWNDDMINEHRVTVCPQLKRIIIAIDPAISTNPDSDETGIIAVGQGLDKHYYIIRDESGTLTPNEWGRRVVNLYYDLKADKIVAEVNQGGDLVESNIRNIDRTLSVKKLHANRGKLLRAEPIQALYERGLVHHVGLLDGLEDQMTSWNAKEDNDSPDRVDALVWALTELTEPDWSKVYL